MWHKLILLRKSNICFNYQVAVIEIKQNNWCVQTYQFFFQYCNKMTRGKALSEKIIKSMATACVGG